MLANDKHFFTCPEHQRQKKSLAAIDTLMLMPSKPHSHMLKPNLDSSFFDLNVSDNKLVSMFKTLSLLVFVHGVPLQT
jgi:hypothetical protein